MTPPDNDRERRPSAGADGSVGTATWWPFVLVMLVVAGPIMVLLLTPKGPTGDRVPISEIADRVAAGEVQSITVEGDSVQVALHDGGVLRSEKESGLSVPATLRQYGVPDEQIGAIAVDVRRAVEWGWLSSLLWIVPLGLVLVLMTRWRSTRTSSGVDSNQISNLLQSRAR